MVKLNATGNALIYGTYLGGSGDDAGTSIAIDKSGDAYITGLTYSCDFPIINAAQTSCHVYPYNYSDAFVTKLNAGGSALVYSTFLGGSNDDYGNGISVDRAGNASVVGTTKSRDFPTRAALQGSTSSDATPFVTKVDATGRAFLMSSILSKSRGGRYTEATESEPDGACICWMRWI